MEKGKQTKKVKMRKKDVARIALLGVLARRREQLSPNVTISASADMFAALLPSLAQAMLQIKATDLIKANLCLIDNTLTVEIKAD